MPNTCTTQVATDQWYVSVCSCLDSGLTCAIDGTLQFGPAIVHKILSLGEASMLELGSIIELCKSAISVLLAELQVCPSADRADRLKVIVATYVPLYRLCEKSGKCSATCLEQRFADLP